MRHGHISATLSHGNLVLLGTEMWGDVRIATRPSISAEQAVAEREKLELAKNAGAGAAEVEELAESVRQSEEAAERSRRRAAKARAKSEESAREAEKVTGEPSGEQDSPENNGHAG